MLLAGCAASGPQLALAPPAAPVRAERLAIVTMGDTTVAVENERRLREAVPLEGDSTHADLFWATFLPRFTRAVEAGRVERDQLARPDNIFTYTRVRTDAPGLERGERTSRVALPPSGRPLGLVGAEADVVLLLERVLLERGREVKLNGPMRMGPNGAMQAGGSTTVRQEGVQYTVVFTLWDNRAGRPLAARRIQAFHEGTGERGGLFGLGSRRAGRDTWDVAMGRLIEELLEALPLARKAA